MRALITGITGFVGSHLADYILANHPEYQVYGIKRWRSPEDNIRHLDGKIKLFDCDLTDLSSLITMARQIAPDVVFHLAAQSYVQSSFIAPADTYKTNVIGTSNLLEAFRKEQQDPAIVVISSSEVYGQVSPENVPINESCPFAPASPYAVSKVGEDMVAFFHWTAYKQRIVRSRAFSHEGDRRGSVFALSAFSKQIAEIEAGLKPPVLKVGNLDSVRTWMDVRDCVRAYWLMKDCPPGEVYNIGGDYTCTIADALQQLCNLSPMGEQIQIEIDPALLRPADVTLQIPDTTKFRTATGWKPEIPFAKTCEDILNYWRTQTHDFRRLAA